MLWSKMLLPMDSVEIGPLDEEHGGLAPMAQAKPVVTEAQCWDVSLFLDGEVEGVGYDLKCITLRQENPHVLEFHLP